MAKVAAPPVLFSLLRGASLELVAGNCLFRPAKHTYRDHSARPQRLLADAERGYDGMSNQHPRGRRGGLRSRFRNEEWAEDIPTAGRWARAVSGPKTGRAPADRTGAAHGNGGPVPSTGQRFALGPRPRWPFAACCCWPWDWYLARRPASASSTMTTTGASMKTGWSPAN